jgi:hypothetical protein
MAPTIRRAGAAMTGAIFTAKDAAMQLCINHVSRGAALPQGQFRGSRADGILGPFATLIPEAETCELTTI